MITKISFNKTIVECKDYLTRYRAFNVFCFNKTIVECKERNSRSDHFVVLGFNKTIVECKGNKRGQKNNTRV